MKTKRLLSLFVCVVVVMTMVLGTTTAFAASGSKKVTSTGSMSVILKEGQSGESSSVSFRVSGLPANAKVTKIVVNPGTLGNGSGAIVSTSLKLVSSATKTQDKIPWGGQPNREITSNAFINTPANATYTISFNSTCYGGAISNGMMLDIGTKIYKNPNITVYWSEM